METMVRVDDDLVARASELTGITEPSALIRAGLEALVRIESARRSAALGWTAGMHEPDGWTAHGRVVRATVAGRIPMPAERAVPGSEAGRLLRGLRDEERG